MYISHKKGNHWESLQYIVCKSQQGLFHKKKSYSMLTRLSLLLWEKLYLRCDRWWERGKKTGDKPIRYATVYSPLHLCSFQSKCVQCSTGSAVQYTNHRCTEVLSWLSLVTQDFTQVVVRHLSMRSDQVFIQVYMLLKIWLKTNWNMIWQSPEVTGFVKIACAFLSWMTSKGQKLFWYMGNVLWWGRMKHFSFPVAVGIG